MLLGYDGHAAAVNIDALGGGLGNLDSGEGEPTVIDRRSRGGKLCDGCRLVDAVEDALVGVGAIDGQVFAVHNVKRLGGRGILYGDVPDEGDDVVLDARAVDALVEVMDAGVVLGLHLSGLAGEVAPVGAPLTHDDGCAFSDKVVVELLHLFVDE